MKIIADGHTHKVVRMGCRDPGPGARNCRARVGWALGGRGLCSPRNPLIRAFPDSMPLRTPGLGCCGCSGVDWGEDVGVVHGPIEAVRCSMSRTTAGGNGDTWTQFEITTQRRKASRGLFSQSPGTKEKEGGLVIDSRNPLTYAIPYPCVVCLSRVPSKGRHPESPRIVSSPQRRESLDTVS